MADRFWELNTWTIDQRENIGRTRDEWRWRLDKSQRLMWQVLCLSGNTRSRHDQPGNTVDQREQLGPARAEEELEGHERVLDMMTEVLEVKVIVAASALC